MDKKQFDRRPDEESAEQGAGKHEPGRKASEVPEKGKGFGKPEGFGKRESHPKGQPIDKPLPKPGSGFRGKDILEGERSDRESGRPVQLEEDDDMETTQPGRADAEPGLGGRQQQGPPDRRSREGELTTR